MEKSGFFDAELVNGQYDRVYLSDAFANYFATFISNGVFAGKLNQMQVMQETEASMGIKVVSGKAWINGYWYENTDELHLAIDVADGVLNRIDAVVIRLGFSERTIEIAVKKGTPSLSPIAPSIQRDSDYYELQLATINVNANTVNIRQSNITDTRANENVCGWVISTVQSISFETLTSQFNDFLVEYNQKVEKKFNDYTDSMSVYTNEQQELFDAWFDNIKEQLTTDAAGNLQLQIDNINSKQIGTRNLIWPSTNIVMSDSGRYFNTIGNLKPNTNYSCAICLQMPSDITDFYKELDVQVRYTLDGRTLMTTLATPKLEATTDKQLIVFAINTSSPAFEQGSGHRLYIVPNEGYYEDLDNAMLFNWIRFVESDVLIKDWEPSPEDGLVSETFDGNSGSNEVPVYFEDGFPQSCDGYTVPKNGARGQVLLSAPSGMPYWSSDFIADNVRLVIGPNSTHAVNTKYVVLDIDTTKSGSALVSLSLSGTEDKTIREQFTFLVNVSGKQSSSYLDVIVTPIRYISNTESQILSMCMSLGGGVIFSSSVPCIIDCIMVRLSGEGIELDGNTPTTGSYYIMSQLADYKTLLENGTDNFGIVGPVASKIETARTIKIGGASKTFDGSQNVSYTLSEIGVRYGTAAPASSLGNNGDIYIQYS